MKQAFFALLLLLCPSMLFAQSATPSSQLAWDQIGQVPTVANGATYKVYVDASTTGAALASVTCTVPITPPSLTDSTCAAPLPALTPGSHTVSVTQVIGGAESAKAVSLTFVLVVVVTPTNLRIR